MRSHVSAKAPEEACGLLGGIGGRVLAVFPAENAARSPVRYEMDVVQQVRIMLDIEARGWELTGIFHSHPAGPAGPSPADVAQAYYPDALQVIWSSNPATGWNARAFEIVDGRVREIEMSIVEERNCSASPPCP